MPAGVNYNTDDTLPGAMLSLTGQRLVIRDSTFSNLVNVAAGSLIVENSDLVIMNTTFSSNSQVRPAYLGLHARFLGRNMHVPLGCCVCCQY